MDRVTPKIRFGIAPGSSARIAEQERKTAEATPQMQIRGGTAARMAEAEPPIATQRPYSISMQARTGKPFTLSDVSGMNSQPTAPKGQESALQGERSASVSEDQLRGSDVRTSSFRPLSERDKISAPTGNVPGFDEGISTGKDKRETQTPPRSPFQTLRDLFSRTLPEQDKKQPLLNVKRPQGE